MEAWPLITAMSKLRGILHGSLLDTDFIACIFTTHCKIQRTDNFSSGLSSMGLLYPPDGLGRFVCAFFLILLLIANAGDLKENWKPPLPEGQSWLQETSDWKWDRGLLRDSIKPKATRSGSWFCKELFGEWHLFYHTAISKCHKLGNFDTRMSESMTARTGVEERALSELVACKLEGQLLQVPLLAFYGLLVIFGL